MKKCFKNDGAVQNADGGVDLISLTRARVVLVDKGTEN